MQSGISRAGLLHRVKYADPGLLRRCHGRGQASKVGPRSGRGQAPPLHLLDHHVSFAVECDAVAEVVGDGGELFQGGLEVFDDAGGKDAGRG
jgi:hypothetical protein